MGKITKRDLESNFQSDLLYSAKSDIGLVGDGVVNDATNLNTWITSIGSAEVNLCFVNGIYKISTNVVFPSNIRLIFSNGAILKIANGISITGTNTKIEAGIYQIFDLSLGGTLAGSWNIKEVYPNWFGLNGTDDRVAINNAISLSSLAYSKVIINDNYNVSIPSSQSYAVQMKSNCELYFTPKGKLTLIANNYVGYEIVRCQNITNFKIYNPYLIGDSLIHTGVTGEWGYGLRLQGCSNYNIYNVYVEKCWGDGVNIDNYNGTMPTNGYIDRIVVDNCRRNGVTIACADGLTIDEIICSNINGTAPKAAVDIESNDEVNVQIFKKIKIGKIRSYLCTGGVQIQPLSATSYVPVTTLDINIGTVEIVGNDTSDTGALYINGVSSSKVKGKIVVDSLFVNASDRGLYITKVYKNGVSIIINNLDIITTTTGDTLGLGNKSAIMIENVDRTTTNVGDIQIKNIAFSGNAPYLSTIYAQTSGITVESGLRFGRFKNKCSVPMYIDGKIHELTTIGNSEDFSVDTTLLSSTYNAGQSWFTYHFLSNYYHNSSASGSTYIAPSSGAFALYNTPITVEIKSAYYIHVIFSGKTIYPADKYFVDGFKSNVVGSKITFYRGLDGNIYITNMIGTWVSETINPNAIVDVKSNIFAQAIIDGNFQIAQKNPIVGTTVSNPTNLTYPVFDMWKLHYQNTGTLPTTINHSQQKLTSGDVPDSYYCYRISPNGAGSGFGATDYYFFRQFIENGVRNLCGAGKYVTLSFYARSTISNKKIGVAIKQNYGTGGSPTAEEVINGTNFNLSSTWTKYTYTFATNTLVAKTFGTNGDDQLQVEFGLMWGSSFATTRYDAGAVMETFGGSGDIEITRVQLNAGNVALSFNPKTFAGELRDVEKYYCKSYEYNVAPGTVGASLSGSHYDAARSNSVGFQPNIYLRQKMRIAPTVNLYSYSSGASGVRDFTGGVDRAATASDIGSSKFTIIVGGTLTAGNVFYAHWTADARF